MKKAVLGVVGALGLVAAAFVAVVAVQPAEQHIERSRVIAAPPAVVWPLVTDLRAFTAWSPWSDLDPTQKVEFSPDPAAVGSWYTWKGNDNVGSGRMEITALEAERKVVESLEFIEPFPSTATVTFSLDPAPDGGTKVTWGFDTVNGFVSKAFDLVVDMDAMLGADFDKGLSRLAPMAEEAARAAAEREAAEAAAQEAAAQEAAGSAEGATPAVAKP